MASNSTRAGRRFIPACAGNAFRRVPASGLTTVHPRMRGERCASATTFARNFGSSPHARGTLPGRADAIGPRRFIPACAGNASLTRGIQSTRSVHPRMRGERTETSGQWQPSLGSSPHARGTRALSTTSEDMRRFIPACAGNAKRRGLLSCLVSVHPRMRGERTRIRTFANWRAGSSPHARGTHPTQALRGRYGRFIPACAGNAGEAFRP